MKVILVNGGPHEEGCTYTALKEIERVLVKHDINTELFWLGNEPMAGCIACHACRNTGKCFRQDKVNAFLEKSAEADGFIFGSPVHYASICGALSSFMERAFYAQKSGMAGKPAAGIVSCRRGGASAAFDRLNKFFTISGMPVVPSQYWNAVHGTSPEEVLKDEEGLQIMRTLGENMAWMLKCIAAGEAAGVPLPAKEARKVTNFIR